MVREVEHTGTQNPACFFGKRCFTVTVTGNLLNTKVLTLVSRQLSFHDRLEKLGISFFSGLAASKECFMQVGQDLCLHERGRLAAHAKGLGRERSSLNKVCHVFWLSSPDMSQCSMFP